MIYLLNVEKDDNGTLLVTCSSFPEVTTFADDKTQVLHSGLAAIEEAIAARIADGVDVPAGATAAQVAKHKGFYTKLPLMTGLKAELYRTMRQQGVTRAELMRELKWKRNSVDRLFRIDHASRPDRIESAFKALHKDVDVRVVNH
jgi:antitoxin HicB